MPLLWPVLAHMALVFVLIGITGAKRVAAAQAGEVRLSEVALSNTAWPEDSRKFANNLANQFETPVLFYALVGIAIFLGATSIAMQVCAWGYLASRLGHTWIHVTSNNVVHRFYAFAAGIAFLIAMWLQVLVRLASGVA